VRYRNYYTYLLNHTHINNNKFSDCFAFCQNHSYLFTDGKTSYTTILRYYRNFPTHYRGDYRGISHRDTVVQWLITVQRIWPAQSTRDDVRFDAVVCWRRRKLISNSGRLRLWLLNAVYRHDQADPAGTTGPQLHDAFYVSAVWMHIERHMAPFWLDADRSFIAEAQLQLDLLLACQTRPLTDVDSWTSASGDIRRSSIAGQLKRWQQQSTALRVQCCLCFAFIAAGYAMYKPFRLFVC